MVGKIADDFILKDQNGEDFNLYNNLYQKILLVFYPKNNSLVCNQQLGDYELNLEIFKMYEINLVGINTAEVSEHKSFCESRGLSFPLLSDIDKEVGRKFDAVNVLGQNTRKLVLIGTNKKILFEKTVFSIFYLDSEEIIKSLKELKIV